MRRKSMSFKSARRTYRKGAKTNRKNLRSAPMRGGWRL